MDLIVELSRIRRQRAGVKYLLPTGENQAMFRDSLLDILEKLGDALHIGELTDSKVRKFNPEFINEFTLQLNQFNDAMVTASKIILKMRKLLPDIYSEDRIVIDRACSVDKEGTEVVQTFFSELQEAEGTGQEMEENETDILSQM